MVLNFSRYRLTSLVCSSDSSQSCHFKLFLNSYSLFCASKSAQIAFLIGIWRTGNLGVKELVEFCLGRYRYLVVGVSMYVCAHLLAAEGRRELGR